MEGFLFAFEPEIRRCFCPPRLLGIVIPVVLFFTFNAETFPAPSSCVNQSFEGAEVEVAVMFDQWSRKPAGV